MEPAQPHILCIDNNASSNLAVYLLERAGYEVSSTSSIADAIELAQHNIFDLYLLNHKLLQGVEIDSCDNLDELAPSTPILFYSTVSHPYQPIEAVHCLLHSHMLMPVNVCDVVEPVVRLLRRKTTPLGQVAHQGSNTITAGR